MYGSGLELRSKVNRRLQIVVSTPGMPGVSTCQSTHHAGKGARAHGAWRTSKLGPALQQLLLDNNAVAHAAPSKL